MSKKEMTTEKRLKVRLYLSLLVYTVVGYGLTLILDYIFSKFDNGIFAWLYWRLDLLFILYLMIGFVCIFNYYWKKPWGYLDEVIDATQTVYEQNNHTVSLSDPTSTRQIVLNTTDPILSDKNVRIALQHATNKENISQGIFYGLEQPADTLFAKTVPYCDIDLEPYACDMVLAGQLLDEAGWLMGSDGIREKDGQKLNLDLLYNSDSVTEKSIAEYLQSEYQSIGIALNIHGEEEQSYRDNMKAGNFSMVFNICWGMPYDPQSSLAAMRAPVYGDFAAQQGLEDKAEIDDAITKILVSTDETERQELYTYVLTRLHEDAVYIPLTYECNKAIYRSDLKGFHFTQTQYEVPFQDFSF